MRLLDTREQKSPRFLIDAFSDLVVCKHVQKGSCQECGGICPYVGNWNEAGRYCSKYKAKGIVELESGDYLSATKTWMDNQITGETSLKGNLVELKIGKDFGIHTEPLERFQDELYRMRLWQQKNPHVDLHAVWLADNDIRMNMMVFHNMCHQYHVWGHIYFSEGKVIEFLKGLDQPKAYVRDEVYMKRTKEPTTLARMFRQFPRISSEMACNLAEEYQSIKDMWWIDEDQIDNELSLNAQGINTVLGATKKGEWTKINQKFKKFLETGDE